jgi:hypothetical protein
LRPSLAAKPGCGMAGQERGVSIGALGEERPHHLEAAALGREHQRGRAIGFLGVDISALGEQRFDCIRIPKFRRQSLARTAIYSLEALFARRAQLRSY